MLTVYQSNDLTIYQGEAVDCPEQPIDLILTNPYGPMPEWTRPIPMLIHQWRHHQVKATRWCGRPLIEVSGWNDNREVMWAANMTLTAPVNLSDLRPEPGGWYPLELPMRLLRAYGRAGMTVWDGFMGRGTVAQAARSLGMRYIGVERLPAHIALARTFLGLGE